MYVDRILNNVFNSDGINYYAACPLTNNSGGSIANMMYYNTQKLSYHSRFQITTSYRDINAYRMFYNSEELAQGDTVFITFIIAHLKAGSNESDENARTAQTQQLLGRLEQIGKADNYVFSGDFNLYGASEGAYQNLLYYPNSLFRFIDPIDREGEWNNNSNFADIHTQSTHSYTEDGECFAAGGMDDRFDFILVSSYLFHGLKGVRSINESYHALGQDGNRFNRSIISPTNSDVPTEIATALYNLSDHLPVILDFEVDASPISITSLTADYKIELLNPLNDQLKIFCRLDNAKKLNITLYTLEGRLLETFVEELPAGHTTLSRTFPHPPGFYLLVVSDDNNNRTVKKVVKVNPAR